MRRLKPRDIPLNTPHWKRDRHRGLDTVRTFNPSYNMAWFMFFGTPAPGVNPNAITERGKALASSILRALVRQR